MKIVDSPSSGGGGGPVVQAGGAGAGRVARWERAAGSGGQTHEAGFCETRRGWTQTQALPTTTSHRTHHRSALSATEPA